MVRRLPPQLGRVRQHRDRPAAGRRVGPGHRGGTDGDHPSRVRGGIDSSLCRRHTAHRWRHRRCAAPAVAGPGRRRRRVAHRLRECRRTARHPLDRAPTRAGDPRGDGRRPLAPGAPRRDRKRVAGCRRRRPRLRPRRGVAANDPDPGSAGSPAARRSDARHDVARRGRRRHPRLRAALLRSCPPGVRHASILETRSRQAR